MSEDCPDISTHCTVSDTQTSGSFELDDLHTGLRLLNRAKRIAQDDVLLSPSKETDAESTNSSSDPMIRTRSLRSVDSVLSQAGFGSWAMAHRGSGRDSRGRVGHFELLEKLGHGAFGTVWKARDTFLDRHVAVKLPHPARLVGNDTSQILREARTAAKIRHPNIVQVHEIGKEGETTYIVSDLIEGQTLTDWLQVNPASAKEAAQTVMTIAAALHVAHCAGIVHRDIKPDNIMIDNSGQPRIMDFGLAKSMSNSPTVTAHGNVVGTPAYMAPEQARGDSQKCDARTDVYALGVLLYQMLTGEVPFRGEFESILLQTIHDEPTRPRKLNQNVPNDLETLCLKCLEKESARRFASAQELADELSRFLSGRPIVSRRIGPLNRAFRWMQRNRLASLFLMITILSMVAGTIFSAFFAWQNHQSALQIEKEKGIVLEQSRALEKALFRAEFETKRATDRLGYAKLGLYNAALAEVESVWKTDPRKAQQILIDQQRCPAECRDFTWDLYYSFCEAPIQRAVDLDREIRRFALSPDNTVMASSDGDSVALHKSEQGEMQDIRLAGSIGDVTNLAFSPNGRLLAAGSRNGKVLIWNCISREVIRSIRPKNGAINAFAFSPDSQRLAIVVEGFIHRGGMGTWSIWDIDANKTVVGPHLQLAFEPNRVCFSPNGKQLAIAGRDRSISIFQSSNGQKIATIPKQQHTIRDLAFANNDILIIGRANQISAWDVNQRQTVYTKNVGTKNILSLSVSSDASRILVHSAYDDYLRLLDVDSLTIHPVIWNRPGIPLFACFSSNEQQIVTTVKSGRIEWKPFRSDFWGRKAAANSVTSNDRCNAKSMMAAMEPECVAKTLAVENVTMLLKRHSIRSDIASMSPDRKAVAYAHSEAIVVRRVSDMKVVSRMDGSNRVAQIAWSPDGKSLAAGSLDGKLFVWDADGTIRASRMAHLGACQSVAYSADGKTLATAGGKAVRLWDGQTVLPRLTLPTKTQPRIVEFSPCGTYLDCLAADGLRISWKPNFQQDRPIAAFGSDNVVSNDLALNESGTILAATGDDGTLRTWDVKTQLTRTPTLPFAEKTTCVAFAADNEVALVGSTNRHIVEVSVVDSSRRGKRLAHTDSIRSLSVAKNGLIVSLGWNGRLESSSTRFARQHTGRHIRHVSLSKNATRCATVEGSGSIVVHDVVSNSIELRLEPMGRRIADIQLSSDGSLLVVAYAGEPGEIGIWNLQSKSRIHHFETARTIRQVAVCHRSRLIWTCEGHVLVIRDLETGDVRSRLIGGSYISRFVVGSDVSKVIVAYGDGSILMWDVPSVRT